MGNLIECPMCGKMISPNALFCPNCGEPMKKGEEPKEVQKEEPQTIDKYSIILEETGKTPEGVNNKLVELFGIDMDTAISMTEYPPYLILDDLILREAKYYKSKLEGVGATISIELDKENSYTNYSDNNYIEDDKNIEEAKKVEYAQDIKDRQTVEDNVIKCPNCRSTNVKRISGLSKAGSVALVGIFSMGKLTKTYECNKCGYRW
ncbi:zinc-ribbon domain-containing protein [Clostridium sp. 001]|uniref:zinc-ribbon domain-containing protein n=1 Tax=Clostridium sp. 001 TaxID=1970093 RepID=UPI001C2C35E2|nr:zinc-ribbon domain-containing protein [Clostridium sp. 001]QXE20052.1 hypothetical protein B5S50_15130 [Clostridium sp. 001]